MGHEIMIEGEKIQRSPAVNYLGIILDQALDWKPQIKKKIKAKIIPAFAAIFKSKRFLSGTLLKQMHFSLVHTHLMYLSGVYGGCAQTYLREIQVLQNTILKTIFGYPRLFHSKDINEKNCIVPFHPCVFLQLCAVCIQIHII